MKHCILCRKQIPDKPIFKLENAPASAQNIPDKEGRRKDKGMELRLYQCSHCGLVQFDCEPVGYYRDVIRSGGYSTTMADLRTSQYKHLIDTYHLEGKKFLHVSTDEVYGSLEEEGGYFYETTPYDPHSPYSASKASSDFLVKSYIDTYHFPANTTNCSNNYGPYQFPEKLIPLIINNALQGKKLPVYGDGKNVRDWLYVDDHAKGIDMVQEQGKLGETYNIGGHNEKQNIEIIHIILETLQEMLPEGDPRRELVTKDLITYVEDRKGHDRRYAIAPDKIKAEIGWEPETMFKEGIRKTIAWFFEHEEWMKNVTSGDYQKYYEEMYQNR